jgi:DNA-binding response OmpR family regulator
MQTKPKVLILDDEDEVGEILAILLEERFDCSVFSDANRALHSIQGEDYKIIITDLEMPQMDGLQFVQSVRDHNHSSKILISTGHTPTHDKVQAALAAGADAVITKPFLDSDQLVESILAATSL